MTKLSKKQLCDRTLMAAYRMFPPVGPDRADELAAGEGAATTIVQAATSPNTAADRVFFIPSGVTVILEKLTIRYGHMRGEFDSRGGGGLFNQGTLTLMNSTVSGNSASYGGGLLNRGTLTLTNSMV